METLLELHSKFKQAFYYGIVVNIHEDHLDGYIAMDDDGRVFSYNIVPELGVDHWKPSAMSETLHLFNFVDFEECICDLRNWVVVTWKKSLFKISDLEFIR